MELLSSSNKLSSCEEREIYSFFIKSWGFPNSVAYHPTKRFNPCPLPISMGKDGFKNLVMKDYFVSEKLDGERYQMVLMELSSGDCIVVMVDRSMHMYEIEGEGVSTLFQQGTLLDGELVQTTDGRMEFIIFDVVVWKGRNMSRYTYTERMSSLSETPFLKSDLLKIKKKKFYPVLYFFQNDNYLFYSKSKYATDGYVFTKNTAYIKTNRNPNMIKWKQMVTVDILVRDKDYFVMGDDGQLKKLGDDLDFGEHDYRDCVVEFQIINNNMGDCKKFRAERARPDKNQPNSLKVFNATILEETFDLVDFLRTL